MLEYKNLDQVESFNYWDDRSTPSLKKLLNAERVKKYQIPMGGGLVYNFAAKAVDDSIIERLEAIAKDQQLIEKYRALLSGEIMNTGEQRKVLHHLARSEKYAQEGSKKEAQFYTQQKERFFQFARDIQKGSILSSTGKKFKEVVQIGIGGSDLGPRALYLSLEQAYPQQMRAHFISNVDPDDANAVLDRVNLEETLFILVSKSGTTQETLANGNFIQEKAKERNIQGLDISKHLVAVTSQTSPLANSDSVLNAFFMDDYIGGRYSSTSAVGGVLLSLAFSPEVFQSLLDGAAEADAMALKNDIFQNAAMMDALIGVYERNIQGFPATVVLPYSQALIRFAAHLQQLDMESNGKSVNRKGEPISYQTGPAIFGEPGTNGQHSFYQWLHQGTSILPLQFIGFQNSQMPGDPLFQGSTSQQKLKANLIAQIVAFSLGKDHENPNKRFAGERPSSLIWGQKLDARSLGALLAHYENKVMFQGFCWNLNSFDQEGVQLGKVLTTQVLSEDVLDPILQEYKNMMEIS